MTTSSRPSRRILREARALQRYACGRDAPVFALRRYARLLGSVEPLALPESWWLVPNAAALLEPVPLLPKSLRAREFERRLFLVMLVTEATPWGARRSAATARAGLASICLAAFGFALIELFALAPRVLVHRFIWWTARGSS